MLVESILLTPIMDPTIVVNSLRAFGNDSGPSFITPPLPTRLACLVYLFRDKRVWTIIGGYKRGR